MHLLGLVNILSIAPKHKSLNSLGLLTQLIPTEVNRRIDDKWVKTNIEHIKVGDVLLANTGDKIAVDGVVQGGFGVCNESHLTGESLLIDKNIGDTVYAGSSVEDGSIHYQAAATGTKTQLGDMMSALQDAQGTKADIARFADKVAAVFCACGGCIGDDEFWSIIYLVQILISH